MIKFSKITSHVSPYFFISCALDVQRPLNNAGIAGADHPHSGKSEYNLGPPSTYTYSQPQIKNTVD